MKIYLLFKNSSKNRLRISRWWQKNIIPAWSPTCEASPAHWSKAQALESGITGFNSAERLQESDTNFLNFDLPILVYGMGIMEQGSSEVIMYIIWMFHEGRIFIKSCSQLCRKGLEQCPAYGGCSETICWSDAWMTKKINEWEKMYQGVTPSAKT